MDGKRGKGRGNGGGGKRRKQILRKGEEEELGEREKERIKERCFDK